MPREADVVQALVEMADTLAGDYDVIDVLTGLAERCVNLLGVSAAGVMLASSDGDLRVVALGLARPAGIGGADQFADEERHRLVVEAFAGDLADADLDHRVPFGPPGAGSTATPARSLLLFVTDLAEHYSQIATYMRLVGSTPPSAPTCHS